MIAKSAASKFIKKHRGDVELLENGKVRFKLTGMDFPASVSGEVLESYFNGRSMRRARVAARNENYDFDAHRPNVMPHKHRDENKFLYCHLTGTTLPRDAEVVKGHVTGKRYLRRLAEAEVREVERQRIIAKRAERAEKAKAWKRNKRVDAANTAEAKKDAEMDSRVESSGDSEDGADPIAMMLSSDGEPADATGSESDEEMAAKNSGSDSEEEEDGCDENGDEAKDQDMGIQVADEPDAFWTRGRAATKAKRQALRAKSVTDDGTDDDTDDEWEAKNPASKRRAALPPPKKKAGPKTRESAPKKKNAGARSSKGNADAERAGEQTKRAKPSPKVSFAEPTEADVHIVERRGGKRARPEKKVHKKARQPPRQKQRAA